MDPTGKEFRTNAANTAFILDQAGEYVNAGRFAARVLMPETPMPRRSGTAWYQKLDAIRVEDDLRTPGSAGPETTNEGAYLTYPTLKQRSMRSSVYDEEVEEAADQGIPLDVQQDRNSLCLLKLLMAREKRVVDIVASDSNFAKVLNVTAAKRWDRFDLPDSNPLKDIDEVIASLSFTPTLICIPVAIQKKVAGHPVFVDLQKYTRADLLTDGGLPPMIRKMRVLSPGMVKLTTGKGITDALGDVWSDDIVLLNPGGGVVNSRLWGWGRTLTYKTAFNLVSEEWRDDVGKATWYRVRDTGSSEYVISTACAGVIRKPTTAT